MIHNTVQFYNKQSMVNWDGDNVTILVNETSIIQEYDDTTDDGTPCHIKRQMYQYDSYNLKSVVCQHTNESLLSVLKQLVIDEIADYDISSNVNIFYLQGNPMWLPDVKRTSLIKSTNIRKSRGEATTVLWDDNNNRYDIPVDMAISMLNLLEMYALDCYNQTAQHKKNITEMEEIERVLSYDYTQGYPEKLHLPEDLLNS